MPNFKNKKRQLLFLTSCLLPLFLFFFNMFFFNIVHALKHYYKPEYKKALSTFTHDDKNKAITVTQAESTNPTQATVNKFLQTPDTLTINTDVTITFNANERKATLAVVANSTRAQGDNVVFTNVTVEKQELNTLTKTPTDQAITVTQAESTNPTQATVNKLLQTPDTLTVGTDVTITFNANERKATLAVVANSTKAQGSVVFTNVTVEKQDLSTFTKPTTETITVTQAEVTSKDQNALNKFLKQAGSLTVNTDATIEFDTTNKKATLAVVANSTKAQGSVVFTNVTVEKQDLSTFTKPTTETITVTQAEVTSKDQNALNKFLKQAGSLTVNTDATIEFDTTNKKATITATPNSTQAKGSVVFTNVTVEKQDLSTFTKPTTETITVTQAESTNPTQATVNKLLQTDGSLNVGTDVTITFNANERKATLASAPDSTKVQGSVVFTNVTVEKQDLSTFTKPTTETITVTQAESTNPTQATVNKLLQTDGSLNVGTDVTITFNANERKATLAVVANSTKVQGSVVFTNVTVEKQDLSTFTKPTTETITVTQAEVTSKDQNALNKFLKQAGSLTVNTDATIEFDTTNKKATITATPNSTQAKGNVVFTNVTVENPTQNPVSVQTPPTNNQNTEESSNNNKTILICLTIFLTII
ncbi:MAG: variable membrane protein [Candidatus Phytoplasma solani]